MPAQNPQQRPIRSFVRRQGRITPSQKLALKQHFSRFGLKVTNQLINLNKVFGRNADIVLEIGFGMGKSLLEMAKAHPDKDYIGIEVYLPGVGALLSLMVKEKVDNIRIYKDDAVLVLNECIKDESLSEINIFFPDPWQKKRHHKRRLIQSSFVELIYHKLKRRGRVHLATDWQNYAQQMMVVMSATQDFRNLAGEGCFVANQNVRFITKFEKHAEDLGHGVWDLAFIKK